MDDVAIAAGEAAEQAVAAVVAETAPEEITPVDVIDAETDRTVAIIEAEGEAAATVAEIQADAAVAIAKVEAADNDARLSQCEAQITEIRATQATLMGAMETLQATLATLILPASEPSSEAIPITEAEAEAAAASLEPESVAEGHREAEMERAAEARRRVRRRLI